MTERFDVMVIGGGVAGLVAALEAATAGARVVLVDGRSLGGRARSSDYDGFRFNQGPHAVYAAGAFAATCRRFGVAVPGGPPSLLGAAVWREGRRTALPLSTAAMVRSRLLTMRSKVAARRVVGALEREDPTAFASMSLAELLGSRGAPEDLTAFIEMVSRLSTYANAPDLISAEAVILQYRLAAHGVIYPDHGWQGVVDGLVARAGTCGVTVHDHRPVVSLSLDEGRWCAAGPGPDLHAPAVVIAGLAPAEVARLTGVILVDDAGPAVRVACLDLGLGRQPEVPLLLGMDEAYYLSRHAPPAKLATDGHSVVQVARYLAPGETPGRDAVEQGLWRHAERAGIPRDAVVTHRFLPDMTVAHGLPLANRRGLRGRPGVGALGRPGLFLAGDWVGPDGLLADAAAASGAVAGRAAQRWAVEAGATA